MNNKMKKVFQSSEFYVTVLIVLFSILVQARSGQFFTGNNLVDLVRAFSVPAMFAVGELMILISGGVDCSFPAIASLSMFVVCKSFESSASNPLVFFVVAALIGLVCGIFNGVIIGKYRFPALIVTLGTSSICWGIMQGVFESREYPLCDTLLQVGRAKLFTATNPTTGLSSDLPVLTILMVVILALGWFILNKTMLGRGIYALGGDMIAAKRAGFNVFRTTLFIYAFSGMLAGIIGVVRACMLQAVHPNNLNGVEMDVIAACVLGGVSLTGGKGTILQACLGTALLTIVSNSLILLGIDTHWQNVVTGIIIIVGTAVTAIQNKKNEKKLAVKLTES
ncbi:MAG: ABC transporter permease [Schaedlerella sp.]|nr:ABC transporter permease [Schaedlerella sp.]